MSFHNFSNGNGHSFRDRYVEIKPNDFLKYTYKFDDPDLPGEITTSMWFRKVLVGTEIKILQEGIPSVIALEMCYLGWQEYLEKLAKLAEPVIRALLFWFGTKARFKKRKVASNETRLACQSLTPGGALVCSAKS